MSSYLLSDLADGAIERGLTTFDAQNKTSLAALLAHLAEFEVRGLHQPTEFPSMRLYCTRRLHWSEQAAFKRIRAARLARRFPVLFPAVADGRLHLGALLLLGPHLCPENADELLAAAAFKRKAEIELLLAARFPREDVPTRLVPVGTGVSASGRVAPNPAPPADSALVEVSPGTVVAPSVDLSPPASATEAPARVTPRSPGRFALQVTLDQETRDLLQRALELSSHREHPGNVAGVLKRALGELVTKLEKRKCGAAARRGLRRASKGARHIPAHVRDAVWARDEGRCTFVSEGGRRCESREQIEYDHVVPVAKGGEATVQGVRLLCRAHNQWEAERVYGAGFMERKREEAKRAREEKREAARRAAEAKRAEEARRRELARTEAEAKREAAQARKAAASDPGTSVIPWLRSLGLCAEQAKRAAEAVEVMADAPLEQRLRAALAFHGRVRFPGVRRAADGMATMTGG